MHVPSALLQLHSQVPWFTIYCKVTFTREWSLEFVIGKNNIIQE